MADRTETITHKILRERSGFRSGVFVHVDHLDGRAIGVRLSEKGKDDSMLDRLFHAIGDEITDMLREIASSQ